MAFAGESRRASVARVLFRDRVGLAVFVAALCLFTVLWVVTWRINDSLTLLNTLHGMSRGKLHVVEVKYGAGIDTPGTHLVGDRVVGRNYGVLTVALVPLFAFELLSLVADLRIALVGLFSLGLLALTVVIGRIVERRRTATIGGCVLALAVFVVNVALATDLDPTRTELYALQTTHMVGAAFLVVLAYRLLAAIHGRRVGLFTAALVALATPTGLWASVPKRHVLTAALVLVLALALYRSRVREATDPGSGLWYRAGGYAAIGLFAWVHAPEALLVLFVYAPVDLATGRVDRRFLGVLGGALAVATIPFLVTNYLLSGSPFQPPRLLPNVGPSTGEPSFGADADGTSAVARDLVDTAVVASDVAGTAVDGADAAGRAAAIPGSGLVRLAIDVLASVLAPVLRLVGLVVAGIENLIVRPGEVWATFVRSGYVRSAQAASDEAINLSVLESAPILAAALGVVPAAIARARRSIARGTDWPPSPERTVDAFLVLFSVAFTLMYLSRLPVHAQITVRYLFPIVPALVVLIVRLPAIRGVLATEWRVLLWSYAVAVLIGGQLLVVALVTIDPGLGEAFQLHAWIGLAIAVPLALWSLSGRQEGRWAQAGAVLIALAAAATTVFLLLLSVEYVTVGDAQALPIVRAIAKIVSFT